MITESAEFESAKKVHKTFITKWGIHLLISNVFQLFPDCSSRSKKINWFMVETESLNKLRKAKKFYCGVVVDSSRSKKSVWNGKSIG